MGGVTPAQAIHTAAVGKHLDRSRIATAASAVCLALFVEQPNTFAAPGFAGQIWLARSCREVMRSETRRTQVNEVLCQALYHNLCCVSQSMHALGITADFRQAQTA